jgi:hypothetical protein
MQNELPWLLEDENYTKVWVGKYLSDMFTVRSCLKQGDRLSPSILNPALEYVIMNIQENHEGL